jgi:hypothetical protein
MTRILALLLFSASLQAAGPTLATAAAVSTLVANTDAVLHPILTARKAGRNIKLDAKLGRSVDDQLP